MSAVTASAEVLHKTRVERDAVTVANGRLAARMRQAEVFAEVRNAFDATYTEVFGAPMPGRVWLGGVRLTLDRTPR